jgi:hypothetical protein
MPEYYHSQTKVGGENIDLLLTENEVKKTAERALKNPDKVPMETNNSWSINCPTKKCSLLKWIMGRCCDCATSCKECNKKDG